MPWSAVISASVCWAKSLSVNISAAISALWAGAESFGKSLEVGVIIKKLLAAMCFFERCNVYLAHLHHCRHYSIGLLLDRVA